MHCSRVVTIGQATEQATSELAAVVAVGRLATVVEFDWVPASMARR